jgi:hypothetical protein
MAKPLRRDVPRLFDGQWTEQRAATARFHIQELREHLDRRQHEEQYVAPDSRSDVTRRRETA